jgi:hypothetical protein
MQVLRPRDPPSRVYFCSWLLQSVFEGEIDPQLTFYSDEAWFHLQRYINTQNNRYWSSQNPYLTHEVPPHSVKVGVWCVIIARRIVVPVIFSEIINCEWYLRVEGQHFQYLLWWVNCGYFIPNIIGREACWFICKIRMRLAAGGEPVVVKRKAVELVNKVKIVPVYFICTRR